MKRLLLLSVVVLSACSGDSRVDRLAIPPEIELVSPTPEAIFRQGEGDISLQAVVYDAADPPTALDIRWTIDDAEPFPSSADDDGIVSDALSPDDLAVGLHDAWIHVTDRDDATAFATVRFEVLGPFGSPTVLITAPSDGSGFDEGQPITFVGEASDLTTAAGDLVLAWSSDLDGPLEGAISAEGESVLVSDELSAGLHVVTLQATDGDDEQGSDSISVMITPPVVIAEPGDLVFSEMMVNPQVVADEVGEWVELYNTSAFPIDVGGYTFRDDDTDEWVLEGPLIAEPQGYIVLCADLSEEVNGGVPCDGWFLRDPDEGLALANNPDELVLTRPDGVEIDWLHYTDDWWVPGASIGVDPDFLNGGDNDDVSHWCPQVSITTSGGEPSTPGAANDPC